MLWVIYLLACAVLHCVIPPKILIFVCVARNIFLTTYNSGILMMDFSFPMFTRWNALPKPFMRISVWVSTSKMDFGISNFKFLFWVSWTNFSFVLISYFLVCSSCHCFDSGVNFIHPFHKLTVDTTGKNKQKYSLLPGCFIHKSHSHPNELRHTQSITT